MKKVVLAALAALSLGTGAQADGALTSSEGIILDQPRYSIGFTCSVGRTAVVPGIGNLITSVTLRRHVGGTAADTVIDVRFRNGETRSVRTGADMDGSFEVLVSAPNGPGDVERCSAAVAPTN